MAYGEILSFPIFFPILAENFPIFPDFWNFFPDFEDEHLASLVKTETGVAKTGITETGKCLELGIPVLRHTIRESKIVNC
jgi:hypothetical protein